MVNCCLHLYLMEEMEDMLEFDAVNPSLFNEVKLNIWCLNIWGQTYISIVFELLVLEEHHADAVKAL